MSWITIPRDEYYTVFHSDPLSRPNEHFDPVPAWPTPHTPYISINGVNNLLFPEFSFMSYPFTLNQRGISTFETVYDSREKGRRLHGVTPARCSKCNVSGKKWRRAFWLNAAHSSKKWWIREFEPLIWNIFFLNPHYHVDARSLYSPKDI